MAPAEACFLLWITAVPGNAGAAPPAASLSVGSPGFSAAVLLPGCGLQSRGSTSALEQLCALPWGDACFHEAFIGMLGLLFRAFLSFFLPWKRDVTHLVFCLFFYDLSRMICFSY